MCNLTFKSALHTWVKKFGKDLGGTLVKNTWIKI